MNGSWDAYLASPADFAGADDVITNLAKETEPGIEIIERTPQSLIITGMIIQITFPNLLYGSDPLCLKVEKAHFSHMKVAFICVIQN